MDVIPAILTGLVLLVLVGYVFWGRHYVENRHVEKLSMPSEAEQIARLRRKCAELHAENKELREDRDPWGLFSNQN